MSKTFLFSGEIIKYTLIEHKKHYILQDDYYYSLTMKNGKNEVIELTLKLHELFYNDSKYFSVLYKIKNNKRFSNQIEKNDILDGASSYYMDHTKESDLDTLTEPYDQKPFLLPNHKTFIARDIIVNKNFTSIMRKGRFLEMIFQNVIDNDRFKVKFLDSLLYNYDFSNANSVLYNTLQNNKRYLFLYRKDSNDKDIIENNIPSYLVSENGYIFFKNPDILEIYQNTYDYKELDNISQQYIEHLSMIKNIKQNYIPNQATKAILADHIMYDKKLSKRQIKKELSKLNLI